MMFSVFSLKNAYSLTGDERYYLRRMLSRYSKEQEGLWLQVLPWNEYEFYWAPGMTMQSGVMGAFTPVTEKKIYLIPAENPEICVRGLDRCFWVESLFPTVIHELRHAYQWKKSKWKYILCSIPVLREFTLEKGANEAQENCMNFLERWQAEQNYREAAARGMAEEIISEDGGIK